MGLTSQSSGINVLRESFNLNTEKKNPIIALAGNPNTGKSTVFNELTGLKQHTGNWPGKTVTRAQGYYLYHNNKYTVVDLPGTYSLLSNSTEEKISRDFICFAKPDVTLIVTDATNLERNLNLVIQITELTDNVIMCLNFMDEVKKKNFSIDIKGLIKDLGIPVVPTIAREDKGINELEQYIEDIINNNIIIKPEKISYSKKIEDRITKLIPALKKQYVELVNYLNFRWLALRYLEGDNKIFETIDKLKQNLIIQNNNPDVKGEL